ncbi:MAG: thioredoxin domain-containing protein [Acidobacteria bacterium]|nr:thioredoxin domain-containing protein [Acidobacteriota bacterium]
MTASVFARVTLLLATVVGGSCSGAQGAQQSASSSPEQVVAEVGGRTITLEEVDKKWQEVDPAEESRVTQLVYQHRRNVLDQMVGDLLIEEAAKKIGVPAAKYLDEETAKRVKLPTDADVQQFYEANKDRTGGRPLDELKGPISEFLKGQRQLQARAQLVDELKAKSGASVKVALDPPRKELTVAAHDPARGAASAPITIIEFSDFQCPFCGRVTPTLDKLRAAYPEKIRFVFKDFPLPNHAEAPKASEAAHCANDQGKYWEMHDRLFANQQALAVPALKQHAAALGLDAATFDRCLDSNKYADIVQADLEEGQKLGIQSTPTLYINGRPVVGAQPYEYFVTVIEEELARKK